jgi:hypothetical protein
VLVESMENPMKVVFTVSGVLRLAFWLLVLGIALGLTLGVPATGAPPGGAPGPACPDSVACPAPNPVGGEVLRVQIH